MPLDVAAFQFSNQMLRPVRDPSLARMSAVNLVAGTYTKGTLLGQITAGAVNDVQTLTVSGSPTGGTFKLTMEWPTNNKTITASLAYNASAATVQAALVALSNVGSGNVTVSGSAGGPWTVTFAGNLAARPIPILVLSTNALTGGTTPSVGIVHTTTGSTQGSFGTYASGNSDGTELPKGILAIDCVVDTAGMASFGTGQGTTGGLWGEKRTDVPIYSSGSFNVADLTGLDANAVTKLAGRYEIGSSSGGVFYF